MLHELRTWPEPFKAIANEQKMHEIRKTDRTFAVGDTLRLREWDPATATYSGKMAEVLVTYLTPGGAWGLPPDLCVMSVELRGYWPAPVG